MSDKRLAIVTGYLTRRPLERLLLDNCIFDICFSYYAPRDLFIYRSYTFDADITYLVSIIL